MFRKRGKDVSLDASSGCFLEMLNKENVKKGASDSFVTLLNTVQHIVLFAA